MPLFTFLCAAALAVDGDTLRCANVAEANGRVRIARIDAPELHDAGGEAAKAALAAMIKGRTVRCAAIDADPGAKGVQARDRFGRIVARCQAGQRDLGKALLVGGHAAVWPQPRRRRTRRR